MSCVLHFFHSPFVDSFVYWTLDFVLYKITVRFVQCSLTNNNTYHTAVPVDRTFLAPAASLISPHMGQSVLIELISNITDSTSGCFWSYYVSLNELYVIV